MIRQFQEQILALIEPTGFVWAWLVVLTLYFAARRRWRSAVAVAVPMLILFVFGSTGFPGWLLRGLERPYAGVEIAALPKTDAIVMLGGGTQPARFEAGEMHLTPAGDRLVMALELARLGKAPILVVGGNAADFPDRTLLESETVRNWITTRRLTDAEVIALPVCADTHDEALNVLKLARERGWARVLLVTSANHMRRAAATFRTAGLTVVPAPCNFLTELSQAETPRGFTLPRAGGLWKISVWMHEEIGWLEYRRRGWISAEAALGS